MDAKLDVNATFSVRVPVMGTFQPTAVKGNLANGIAVTVDGSTINGKAQFYISDKWVYINLAAVVFGQEHGPTAFGLFPLPYVVFRLFNAWTPMF
ncbi:hypothetical protein C8J57DRAFT_1092034 [Mycena rebaudengoi]|nr:hypothetical protein C8J57DRAFT_1092034 [Mycena rebaudengoi]